MEVSVLSHVTNAALVVYLLQYLKGTAWYRRCAAWLPIADKNVHVVMSAIGAAATSLGMHGAVTGSVADGWKVALAIPPLWVIAHAAWDWGQQFALNQLTFALAVQQKAAAPVVTVPVGHSDVTVTAPIKSIPEPLTPVKDLP